MKKEDLIETIPLIILAAFAVNSIIEISTTDYVFGIRQHIGLTLLAVSIFLFFINRKIYRYIFGITLVLGFFNLIGFTTSIFSLNIFGFVFQLFLLPIILIFIWISKEQIKLLIRSLVGTSEEQIIDNSQSKINGFKRRFEHLSDTAIESKLKENLLPEAIKALEQIQQERLDKL